MKTIEWKVVDGFPHYEISTSGTLRSWRRKTCRWRASKEHDDRRESPVDVPGTATPLGYVAFILRKPGDHKPHRRTAHRLVALAFLPNPLGLTDVAHNDGNGSNNNVENLRWSTHRDNQMDMRRHGTMQDGTKSCTCKLTPQQVADIRKRSANGERGMGRRLAAEYGISTAQVSRIKNAKRWAAL